MMVIKDLKISFSHHSFENEFVKRGGYNKCEVRDLINRLINLFCRRDIYGKQKYRNKKRNN